MSNKVFRKFTMFLLVSILALSIGGGTFADSTDIEGHWAKDYIEYLVSKDIMSGYSDGVFKPDKEITRAEFVKMINGVFGYTEEAKISFSDVEESKWYYKDIAKGVAAGYINGYSDGTMKPNKAISRQEAAKIIALAYNLDGQSSTSADGFKDSNKIEDWARNYVGIMKDRGLMTGYEDGTFGPKKNITRGEVAKILYIASGEIINAEGEYEEDADGNVVVNKPKVELKNMTVKGDLYLTEGIGNGDVILDGVVVKGNVYVRGGGDNSIKIINSKINNMIINKKSGKVRVVLKENAGVSNISLNKNGILVVENGAKIDSLKANGKANVEVQKGGNIKELEVNSKGVEVKSEGTIEKLFAKEEVKVNDKVIEKDNEIEIENGKIKGEESNKKPDKEPDHPAGGGGGGFIGGGDTGNEDTPTPPTPPAKVDKEALKQKIAEAEELKEIDYTKESWDNLQSALNSAKVVAGKIDATQTEVDSALNNLVNAINGLVKTTEIKAILEFTPDEILNEGFELGKIRVYVAGIPNADKYSVEYSVRDEKGSQTKLVKTQKAKIGEENPDLIQLGEGTQIKICIYDSEGKVISVLGEDNIKIKKIY